MFLTALTVLEKVCRTEGEGLTEGEGDMETEGFYFSVFSEGKDTIDRQREWTYQSSIPPSLNPPLPPSLNPPLPPSLNPPLPPSLPQK